MCTSENTRAIAAISTLGKRATLARVRALEVLYSAEQLLSHAEIESKITSHEAIDRVTLYRALDWLVEQKLAHKVEGYDRTWLFAAVIEHHEQHAHFHCSRCGKGYCITQIKPKTTASLPPGFSCDETQLSFRGICPDCQYL